MSPMAMSRPFIRRAGNWLASAGTTSKQVRMELQLQPLAPACFVSGQPFTEGNRVASFLVRGKTGEVMRYDVLESEQAKFAPEGVIACRWGQVFKLRKLQDN